MKHPAKPTSEQRFLVPWALFAGVIASFAACCLAGRATTEVNQFQKFTRFHQRLSQEALFYPTASQIKQLGLKRTRKDRINVIIGGSSVLNGTGQQPHELWSDELARLLGPDYRVLNLALRSGATGEFGAIAAEMLLSRRKIIFVADGSFGGHDIPADGRHFRYFFWDAYFKKLIRKGLPVRAESIKRLFEQQTSNPVLAEAVLGGRLDSELYFNDLWNTLAYTHGGTTWNLVLRAESFDPKRTLKDLEPAPPPLEKRVEVMARQTPLLDYANNILRRGPCENVNGQWVINTSTYEKLYDGIMRALPNEEIRRRSIIVVKNPHPEVLRQCGPENRQLWNTLMQVTAEQFRKAGVMVAPFESRYTEEDYADQVHLAASGGDKLAAQLAPMIQELAEKLGYKATPRPTTGNK